MGYFISPIHSFSSYHLSSTSRYRARAVVGPGVLQQEDMLSICIDFFSLSCYKQSSKQTVNNETAATLMNVAKGEILGARGDPSRSRSRGELLNMDVTVTLRLDDVGLLGVGEGSGPGW